MIAHFKLGFKEMNESRSRLRWPRLLLGMATAWLLVGGLLLLQLWPDLPRTTGQWALFLVVFPFLYLVGEMLGTCLLSPTKGHSISGKRFSLIRVLVALPLALAWFALAWWFATFIGGHQ